MELLKKYRLFVGVFITAVTIVASTNDQSAARLELKLVSFSSNGRVRDGTCCDSATDVFGCNSFGASDCDPQLKVCLGGKCSWTKEYSNKNSFDFGEYLSNDLTNPLFKEYYPTWPGSASVSMFVWDIDPGTHDEMGPEKSKIYTHTADRNDALSLWQRFDFSWTHAGGTVTVEAEIRVFCEPNFYGTDCGVACIHGDTDDRGHYECHPDTGAKICHKNYFGDDCKKKCVPQDNDTGHYFCDNDGKKICRNGWQGPDCTLDVDECDYASPCGSRGNCTNLNGSYECACEPEYTGTHCDEVKQFCNEKPCSHNTTVACNNTFGGYECICEQFWRGRHCELPPYCYSSPCSETGVCNDTDDGYVCLCQGGWQGRDCSEKITPCTSSPCLHGGKCSVVDDSYNCTCVGPWEGTECQDKIIQIYKDNRTIVIVGTFTPQEETEFRTTVKELLVAIDFPNCTVDTVSTYDETEDRTSILITATSHDPRIQGALQNIPISLLGKNLPLYSEQTEPVTKPAPKPSPWVKEHWYVILLIVLVLLAIIAAMVIFLFVMKKRRLAESKQSGFDDDAPVRPVNDAASADAAIGFDNSLYYEIRNPDSIAGLPNGKTLDY